MEFVKEFLQSRDWISPEEKEKVLTQGNTELKFVSRSGIEFLIKEYDNQRNKTYAEIVQIESAFIVACTEEKSIEVITKINVLEPFGVYFFSIDSQKIVFRSIAHCKKEKYVTLIDRFLTHPDHGHLSSPARFLSKLS